MAGAPWFGYPTSWVNRLDPPVEDEGVSEYGYESLWRDTAMADAERARDLAARLERRAKAEDEVAAREVYLTLLDISAGERVLDVGCGSGAVTRDIARRVGERGLAVGLDPSAELLAVARGLAKEASLGDRVEFREGNALRLPFPDRSFDVVMCATVLSHVPEGDTAIPEFDRVLRPGGRLGVFDFRRYDDLHSFRSSPHASHRRRGFRCDSGGRPARAAPAFALRARWHRGRPSARVLSSETEPRSFYASMADRSAEIAVKVGVITESERRACSTRSISRRPKD